MLMDNIPVFAFKDETRDIYRLLTVNKTPVSESSIPVLGVKLKVVVRILVIFRDIPMLNHINGKLSPRPFK